ncbi:MAG: putative thymidylate kinase [Oscillospiraceae bacterium]|nr:putative thymidylate kinase [Oscillospiraceae bacterium]
MKGKVIVLDGLDGSGKTTQFELLKKEFDLRGILYRAVSFPNYSSPSSELVKMYLRGDFSKDVSGVNAYAASSFYAVDRYASYKLDWGNDYENGALIVASRYVSSNAMHQMVKLPKDEWDCYLKWLDDFEHNKLGIPRADKVVFLDMPVEISQKLLSGRYGGDESKKDIHESNVEYLKKCREAALYASKALGWSVVECSAFGEVLKEEEIFLKIMKEISEVL